VNYVPQVKMPIFPEWNMTMPFMLQGSKDVAHWGESMKLHHVNVLVNAICN
jgi:hypothetical protein